MEELIWRIFESSGHIESYLLYRSLIDCQGEEGEEVSDEDSTNPGNSPTVL